jgi:transposase-like protein
MGDERKPLRILGVQRFRNGERPESICSSLGRSKSWLYKWIRRYQESQTSWAEDRPHCHLSHPMRTSGEIEEMAKVVRLDLI